MEISWDQIGQGEWERLADLARAPMQQRWVYGALGGQVMRAVVTVNGQPVALCQCVVRRVGGILNTSLATHGPLWLTACDRSRALNLIRRSLPLPYPRAQLFTLPEAVKSLRLIPLMTPTTNALLELPVAIDTLHGKWRNSLKRAQNSGLRSRHITCPSKMLLAILQTDQRQQADKSYRALPAEFTLNWHQIAPDDLRLITVSKADETLASALFIRHGNIATYHIAHTTDQGRNLSAQRLALWRAFSDFAKQSVRQIDLGILDTVNAPGLARFKLGTGATAQQFGPTVLAI